MIPFTGSVRAVQAGDAWLVEVAGIYVKGPCPKHEALQYIRQTLQCKRVDP